MAQDHLKAPPDPNRGYKTKKNKNERNDSSADPKQIGWRLLAEESWLRNLC